MKKNTFFKHFREFFLYYKEALPNFVDFRMAERGFDILHHIKKSLVSLIQIL